MCPQIYEVKEIYFQMSRTNTTQIELFCIIFNTHSKSNSESIIHRPLTTQTEIKDKVRKLPVIRNMENPAT